MLLRHSNVPYAGKEVEAYFDNFLPDSKDVTGRIQARYNTASTNPCELLKHIGRDCFGSVRLLSTGDKPVDVETIQSVPLDDTEVAGHRNQRFLVDYIDKVSKGISESPWLKLKREPPVETLATR